MPLPVAVRCYRCLTFCPEATLRPVHAECGCEHEYCEECLRDERLAAWLRFVGSICTNSVRAA